MKLDIFLSLFPVYYCKAAQKQSVPSKPDLTSFYHKNTYIFPHGNFTQADVYDEPFLIGYISKYNIWYVISKYMVNIWQELSTVC